MKTKTLSMQYKRKRLHITNYKKRLIILSGNTPRLVIRKSLKNITLQMAVYDDKGDKISLDARSSELKKFGWNFSSGNMCAAYLTGILFGCKAKNADFNLVADIGFFPSTKGSRIYAAIKGAIDSGIKLKCDQAILPKEDRINGKHIVDYANKLKKESSERFEKQFSSHLKKNIDLNSITEQVKVVKENIIKGYKNG